MEDKEKKPSFAQLVSVLRWLIVYNIKLAPGTAISSIATSIIGALRPLINAYIFARLIDVVVKAVAGGENPRSIVPMLGILLAYNLADSAIGYIKGYLGRAMFNAIQYSAPQQFYQHINSLGIQTLENPDIVNKIQRAREASGALYNDFDRVIVFLTKVVTLVVAALIVFKIMPILVAIILIAALPGLISDRYFMRQDWKLYRDTTEERRKANFAFNSLIETSNLQEITITSAYGYLSNVYKRFADRYCSASLAIVKRWNTIGYLLGTLEQIASIFGYFVILKNLFSKIISIGDVTFQMRSLDIFVSNLGTVVGEYGALYERSIRINEVKEVFEIRPIVSDGEVETKEDKEAPAITLKEVRFKYPNSDRYVIDGLNLEIKPGEKIAIVGENGAGKTTLVKLLSRFYKVDEGGIYLGGENINDIRIASWYKKLGVLFQDYNTYSALTLRENILLGDSHIEPDEARIGLAANKANVNSFIGNYKNGYDQVLSEKFKGGTRPSTGQWQKIAIARFFYRNSPVVIFDEPTASIDAVSEAEIFGQIYEFFKNKTVIIISHRFSTVRNADRIYVMDNGSIVESGNHDELMALKGKYYNAFTIQAEGYK